MVDVSVVPTCVMNQAIQSSYPSGGERKSATVDVSSALHLNCHLNYFHPTSDYFQLEDNYNEPLPLFLILTSICSVLICSPPRIFLSLHLPYSHFFSSEPHGLPPTPTKLHEKWSTTSADENSRSTVNDSDTLNLYPSLYTILVSTITDDHQDAGSTLTHSTTLVRRSTFLQLQELKEAVTFISKLINKEAELALASSFAASWKDRSGQQDGRKGNGKKRGRKRQNIRMKRDDKDIGRKRGRGMNGERRRKEKRS
ncbi:hypothetical protein FPQ18DRAFT_389418 [Pyronema domesticum]|nr:hypothetical protein FPQ18DRAFT_389418 [Pyronema domesticum]